MPVQLVNKDSLFDLDDDGEGEKDENSLHLAILTFRIGPQIFGVDVRFVREILNMRSISVLPNSPHDILGMTEVRGQAVAMIDLASKLDLRLEEAETSRIIIFDFATDRGNVSLGVIADEVRRVHDTATAMIEPVPETLSGWQCQTIQGLIRLDESTALFLDIQRLLCAQELSRFDLELAL